MADEQTPQSDLIDDAIRQAERQLEEKLQALRMSALGDTATPTPTPVPRAHESEPEHDGFAWEESGGDDVSFVPVGSEVPSAGVSDLYVPEQEHPLSDDEAADDSFGVPSAIDETADALRESLNATVTDLTPVWDEEDEPPVAASPPPPMPTTRRSREPRRRSAPRPQRALEQVSPLPNEDELQFWAHTRTALRNLQQITDETPAQVVDGVSTEVGRLLRDELSGTEQAVRSLQASTEHELPRMAEQLQQSVEQAIAAPNNAIRQVRDEIPLQLDRAVHTVHEHMRDELDRTSTSVHGAVHHDIAQLEQSIATNVTRLSQGTTEAVGRVEQDVDVLGETVVRFERGVHAEFDRFEAQLSNAIERVESTVREELTAPTETLRRLDVELPKQFDLVERTIAEQLRSSQRDLSQMLSSLVEADRATIDRLSLITSSLDDDRARRSEDLDIVVDTVTTGWEALAGAVRSLFEQADENSRRLAAIEQRLMQIRDVEGALERTLGEFKTHMRDLKPSPIVVTVSHDEAEVRNQTRAGWTAPGHALGDA